jgi:hypothetical protein
MSKKNKNKYQQQAASPAPMATAPVTPKPELPAAAVPPPEAPASKAESLLASVGGFLGAMVGTGSAQPKAPSATASLEARLEEALAQVRLADEECQKQKKQAEDAEQASNAARTQLWSQQQLLESRKQDIDQREQAVFRREQAVSEREEEATQRKQRLDQKESENKHHESQLLLEREALKTRELNAEAGFAQQRRQSLEQLDQEAKALHQLLSEQRDRISSERAAWEKERAAAREQLEVAQRQQRTSHEADLQKKADAQGQLLRQERADHEQALRKERAAHEDQLRQERTEHDDELRQERTEHDDELREEWEELEEERAQLEKTRRELASERRKLDGDREDLKDDREHLEARAQQLAARHEEALRHERDAMEQRWKEAQRERDRLDALLAQREEVDRRFGHLKPEEVLGQLQALREKRDELEKQLATRPGADAAERLQALVIAKDQWEQDRLRLSQENQSLKMELARQRVAVVEIETIRDQKAALESSRDLLQATIKDLRKDVDERIRASDGRSPFPSLAEMDSTPELQGTIPLREEPPKLKEFVEELQQRIADDAEARKAGKKLTYPLEVIRGFLGGMAMSPLLLLQGISGTGKTTLPRVFARAIGAGNEVIEVQAGWRDKHDLIGHFNAFEKRFYEEPFLRALYRARCPRFRDTPFLIVMDEMNLSHPEQYFAELLSAMELELGSQRLHLMTASVDPSPEGLDEKGRILALPPNVWFVGTANHDETTKDFADKTYDRAHVMEFHGAQSLDLKDKPYEKTPPLSLLALRKAFAQAQVLHANKAKKAQEFLRGELSELLKQRFRIGISNRLERQLKAYVPVIIDAGGSLGEAVDHILATKLLRKLRNQHNTRGEDLLELREYLETQWSKHMDGRPRPESSLSLIADQLKRLGAHDGEEAA